MSFKTQIIILYLPKPPAEHCRVQGSWGLSTEARSPLISPIAKSKIYLIKGENSCDIYVSINSINHMVVPYSKN